MHHGEAVLVMAGHHLRQLVYAEDVGVAGVDPGVGVVEVKPAPEGGVVHRADVRIRLHARHCAARHVNSRRRRRRAGRRR